MFSNRLFKPIVASSLSLLFAACGGSSGGANFVGSKVTVGVADAPVDDAAAVMVKFDSIELKPASGQSLVFPIESGPIDLLQLQGGAAQRAAG